jgi:Spy/CpxP family protein refolding chaperone
MKLKFLTPFMTLLASMMLLSGAAYAQDDASVMDRLNLSESQKTQIKDLREKFRTETEQLRTAVKQLLEEEKQLRKANPPNEAALRSKMKERADKEIELSLALTRFNERLEGILTADQRRILDRIREEKRKSNR